MRTLFTGLFFLIILSASRAGGPTNFAKMNSYELLTYAGEISWKHLDSALAVTEIALEKSFEERNWVYVWLIYRNRGLYFENHNRPVNAIPEYEKARWFADSLGSERAKYLPVSFTDLAIANRKAGNYTACKNWHEQALAFAINNGNAELEEDSYHGLGFLNETIGEWERAIEFYQKSITVAERRKNQEGVIITTQNVAKTFLRAGNRELALKKIEEAWQLALAQPDTIRRAHVLNDYGEILAELGAFEQAGQKFQTSLAAYESRGDEPMIGRALFNLGDVFSKRGDDSLALVYFEKSFGHKSAIRPEDLVNLYARRGTLFQKIGRADEAKKDWEECLALSAQLHFQDVLQKAHFALSGIADQKNRPEEAFFHLKMATSIGDSLTGRQKDLKLAEMEFKFGAARADQKIQQLKVRNSRMIFLGISGVLALALAFLFFRNREKARSNQVLFQKNHEIERQNHKLQESNLVLQQFAWASAHDLKEPLRTISSFIGLIHRRHGESLHPEAREYMTFVREGAHRMNNLLTDLLEYSTLCAEDPTGNETVSVRRGLRDVMGNLREAIQQRGAVIDLPNELPKIRMQRSHFVQLFQNLIGNGLKFSPDRPEIEIGFSHEKDGSLLFSVKDQGIGIDPTYQEKIFQVFHRLHKTQFEGTGIGLAICKNIIDKYGGQLWFESESGRGATFFMRFPAEMELFETEMVEERELVAA